VLLESSESLSLELSGSEGELLLLLELACFLLAVFFFLAFSFFFLVLCLRFLLHEVTINIWYNF